MKIHGKINVLLLTILFCHYAGAQDKSAAPQQLLQQMESRIKARIDALYGVTGIAVCDIDGDYEFSINGDAIFTQASVIKVPILVTLYHQVEAGLIDLHQTVNLKNDDKVGGSGVLQHLSTGQTALTVRDLAVLMIVLSDNTATNMLISLVGMQSVNEFMDKIGLQNTRLNRIMMDGAAWQANRENLSTPLETAKLFQMLYQGDILSSAHCREILEILSIDKPGRIKKMLPESVVMAHKTGEVGGVVNDAGILLISGKPVVCVIMTGWVQDETAADEMLAEVGKMVHDTFSIVKHSNRFGHR